MKTKRQNLMKELDTIFSRFIRYRDKGQCYTCPNKNHPKRMQCGHFNPRQYLATRYDERNNHCQCYACNMLYAGQPATYAVRLKLEYGDSIIEELEQKRWQTIKDFPFQKLIDEYKEKLIKVENDYLQLSTLFS